MAPMLLSTKNSRFVMPTALKIIVNQYVLHIFWQNYAVRTW